MTDLEIVKAVFNGLEAGDLDIVSDFISPSFVITSSQGIETNKDGALQIQRLIRAGFPDWSYNAKSFEVTPDHVRIEFQASGTHTRTFDLSVLGYPAVPATGRFVLQPPESFDVWIMQGRVVRMHLNAAIEGGIPGIYRQILPERREYWDKLFGVAKQI
jgi:hypothetical protein